MSLIEQIHKGIVDQDWNTIMDVYEQLTGNLPDTVRKKPVKRKSTKRKPVLATDNGLFVVNRNKLLPSDQQMVSSITGTDIDNVEKNLVPRKNGRMLTCSKCKQEKFIPEQLILDDPEKGVIGTCSECR